MSSQNILQKYIFSKKLIPKSNNVFTLAKQASYFRDIFSLLSNDLELKCVWKKFKNNGTGE